MEPKEAIQAAKNMGLDGICFTEHDRAWELSDITELSAKYSFPVFRGVEVMLKEGCEILVFGLNMNFTSVIDMQALYNLAIETNSFMIAAHPFRGLSCNTPADFDKTAELVLKKSIYDKVNGIEGYNGRNMDGNNAFAVKLAGILGVPVSGGSDAHVTDELGKCITVFDNTIRNEVDFLAELKAGRFKGSTFTPQL